MAAVLGTGIPSLLCRRLRAGWSPQYLQCWMESDCPDGTKNIASAAGSRGGSRPQMSTGKPPLDWSLLFPTAPPPPQTNTLLPLPSRHPQIERGVTLFAGSICRQGASDAMPGISTTYLSAPSALQTAVLPRVQFMLPPPTVPFGSCILETIWPWPFNTT